VLSRAIDSASGLITAYRLLACAASLGVLALATSLAGRLSPRGVPRSRPRWWV